MKSVNQPKERVTIVGAGLAGSLLSILLAQQGYDVQVYERRPDMRLGNAGGGRSINLALSVRGISALEVAGVSREVMAYALPMRGRMIHDPEGNQTFQTYHPDPSNHINSISRSGLNIALLNAAERYPNVKLHFGIRCHGMDLKSGTLQLEEEATGRRFEVQDAPVFGTDGAGSPLRESLVKQHPAVKETVDKLEYGYKELTLMPDAEGRFVFDHQSLHIWPRGHFMLIALPNPDKTFTCTLFLPHEGPQSFEKLKDAAAVNAFFAEYFADLVPHKPDQAEEFLHNPTGNLGTVRCNPWHYEGKLALLGDAAHAVVPFYGQGMNASFEDCVCLNQLMRTHGGDWAALFDAFTAARVANANAIADLALYNFVEMRDFTADPTFALKRKAEVLLEDGYPQRFASKYSMVSFSNLPYLYAKHRGDLQDRILMDVCRELPSIDAFDAETTLARIESEAAAAGLSRP